MKIIEFTHPHRKKHFEFFRQMNHPHFNICANVDITNFLSYQKEKKLPFTPSIVYALAFAANSIPQFRQRIRAEQIVEHEAVHPSFSVWTEVADVFSFCEVKFERNFDFFVQAAKAKIESMRTNPSLEDEPGRDDYLFLSPIPWISFTGFQHAMSFHPSDSVPRITWGKYFEENGLVKMPLSVQVHHALVDGRHVGSFFLSFEEITKNPEKYLF